MKTNTMMRVASVLLVAVLLSTCAISGTFAKYVSTASGSDTARVAKWSIEVEDTEIGVAGDTTVAFDLFQTVNDTGNAANDEDVEDGENNNHIIAPGTAGSFEITIENLSEVNAQYTIVLSETNQSNIPLQYSVDGQEWKDSIAELVTTSLTDVAIGMNQTANQTVYWRWVFEGTTDGAHAGQTDVTDTALGYGNSATVTITASITVEQVD